MSISANLLPGVPLIESPLFEQSLDQLGLSDTERAIAVSLNRKGYAVLDFPDPHIDERIERITASLTPRFGVDPMCPKFAKAGGNLRIQDAWLFDPDIKAIATNKAVLALLTKLYGRAAFPFQTLNFPVGTQQHLHSDSIHFSSHPERFMCGVWLAMEDVHHDAGPLQYLPGSHKWPIASNAQIGRIGSEAARGSAQTPFEPLWRALVHQSGIETETFLARKGQALIWAANLLHGGGVQHDLERTRWSQVTHYYFEDCLYYTPAFSDEPLGQLDLRTIMDVSTGKQVANRFHGEVVAIPIAAQRRKSTAWINRLIGRKRLAPALPRDFDPAAYYRLNPDVAGSGVDASDHYRNHGAQENRRYRDD